MKKRWNMKVTVIPIVNGALGTIPKGLIKRMKDLKIERPEETLQTTALSVKLVRNDDNIVKYLDLASERKQLWNMKVIVIPIVNGALGAIPKGLIRRLKDLKIERPVETLQTTALSVKLVRNDDNIVKCLNLVSEQKQLWNMKVTIVVGAHGTVLKSLKKRLEEW